MRAFILVMCITWAEGCLFVDPHDPDCHGSSCYPEVGDILFYWGFELSDRTVTDVCEIADVARVDTFVYDDTGHVEFEVLNRPCGDLGLEIENFVRGAYELEFRAYCPTGLLTHQGVFPIWVDGGDNDYGLLVLDYLGPCF